MSLLSKIMPAIVAATTGFFSPATATPAGDTKIYDFEDGNSALDGWSLAISNTANVSKTGINTSSKCIKCVPGSGCGYGGYLAKWNTLNFNGSQGLSMMVFSSKAVGDITLGLRYGESDGSNAIERTFTLNETGKWVKVYFDLSGVSGSFASFNIKFANEVTYYVDNICYTASDDIPEAYRNNSGTGSGNGGTGSYDAGSADAAFEADYYKKALWITTRFYGAQRSGKGVNWLLADYSKNFDGYSGGKSYIKDADGSYDLTGGWFDCGDYVKFGQTEFYSCYMLLLGYSEFKDGYIDLYSPDYHGYTKSGNYTYEGAKGVPNGIPDILDECKYATDYFIKCVRSKNKFYYQVGDGNADHQQWTTSVYKSKNLSVSEGGESNGSRPVYSLTSGGTSMVALCGASLAAMYRLYKDFDSDYANSCLAKAKICEQFINNGNLGNVGSEGGSFYPAKEEYAPDLVIFYSEMYRATGTASYKTKAATYFSQMKSSHGWSLCYNNTNDIADYVYYTISESSAALSQLQAYANSYKGNGYFLNQVGDNTWGPLRYTANQAFLWALYSKAMGGTTLNAYTLRTIDYIIGDNNHNFSFVTGLGDNYPKKPHYRNVYLNDQNNMYSCTLPSKYAQLGYMVGGNKDNSVYNDDVNNYFNGEGGIDYNAGLVGALAYINMYMKSGEETPKPVAKTATKISIKTLPKTSYLIGESLDVSGGKLTVKYSDGTSETVALSKAKITGFSSKKEGNKTLTVSYKDLTTTFVVTITKPEEPQKDDDNNGGNNGDNNNSGNNSDNQNTENNTGNNDTPNPNKDDNRNDEGNNSNTEPKEDVPTSIGDISTDKSRIYSHEQTIVIEGVPGSIYIYNAKGQLVYTGKDVNEIQIATPGIYIVKTNTITRKVIISR